MKLSLIAAAVGGLGLASATQAALITKFWDRPISGSFSANSLWSPTGAPFSSDNAFFEKNGAYTVLFTANQASNQFLIGSDKLTFDLGNKTYTLKSNAANAPSMVMGMDNRNTSRLTLRNGQLQAVASVLGNAAGSKGSVSVTNDAIWSNSGVVTVGNFGSGNITVTRGGQVNSAAGRIGVVAGSAGKAIVSASGSQWSVVHNLLVGGKTTGKGILDIRPGASVDVGQLLDIRHGGTLKLQGGTLTTGDLVSSGLVVFKQGHLNLTDSDLSIGTDGPLGPTVHLKSGQHVRVDQTINIAPAADLALAGGSLVTSLLRNSGHFDLSADAAQLNGDLTNDAGASVNVTAPQARFAGTVAHFGAEFSVAQGSTATFVGDVTGSSNFTGGGQLLFQSRYAPTGAYAYIDTQLASVQNSPAQPAALVNPVPAPVSVIGSVTFEMGASLDLTLRDYFYNQLNVSGPVHLANVNVSLGASLSPNTPAYLSGVPVSLTTNYLPQVGDTFTLVTGQSITYSGSINVPQLPNGLSFDIIQGPQALSLQVIPEPSTMTVLAFGGLMSLLARRPRRK